MAKDDVKSIKMDSDLKSIVNERIERSGMEGAEWLESLMALEVIHRIRKDDVAVEQDLKELEKFMNRIYHILIRIYQRGADAVEEVKEHSMEEASRVAQELESLRIELSQLQKQLKQKEEELSAVYLVNDDLRAKMDQIEKTNKAVEELNLLTNEKMRQLEIRNDELLGAEKAAEAMKEQLQDSKRSYEQELVKRKEEEAKIRQQLAEQQKEIEHMQKKNNEEIDKLKKEHERELEMTRKQIEMEARDKLLTEKSKWQEIKTQELREQSEHYNLKIAELLERMQDKK